MTEKGQEQENPEVGGSTTTKLKKKSSSKSKADDGSVGTKKKKKGPKKEKPKSSKSSGSSSASPKTRAKARAKERVSSFRELKNREKLPDVSGSSPAVVARKKVAAAVIVADDSGSTDKKKKSKSSSKSKKKKTKSTKKSTKDGETSGEFELSPPPAPPSTEEQQQQQQQPEGHSEKVLKKKIEKADRILAEMKDPSSEKYKKLQSKRQEYIAALDQLQQDMGEMDLNDGMEGEMGLNDDEEDDEDGGFMYLNDEGEMGLNDDDDEPSSYSPEKLQRSKSLQEMNPAWSRSFRAEKEKEKRRQASLGRHQERKKSMRENKDRNKSTKKRTRGIRQALNAGEDFKVPVYKKSKDENSFLKASLKGDFVFQNLEKKSFKMFLDAFEQVQVPKGQDIIKEGDTGDYFYVVAEGKVKYYVNGKLVGRGQRGKSFGEAALLYTAPRSATVTAAEDTTLYRVDQQTFKFITQRSAKELRQQKLELLRNVDFLGDLLNDDLQRLCDLMVPRIVDKDDFLYQKDADADAFYILQSGEMKATDIVVGDTVFEDIAIHPGDYFGQNALARDAPRENSVLAVEESAVYGIDRTTFDKVLGSFYNVILKTNDRQLLVSFVVVPWLICTACLVRTNCTLG